MNEKIIIIWIFFSHFFKHFVYHLADHSTKSGNKHTSYIIYQSVPTLQLQKTSDYTNNKNNNNKGVRQQNNLK